MSFSPVTMPTLSPASPASDLSTDVLRFVQSLGSRDKQRFRKLVREHSRSDLAAEFDRVLTQPGEDYTIMGQGLGATVVVEQGQAAVDAAPADDMNEEWAASELVGVGALATRLGVSSTTLANWRVQGHAIAFRRGRRNFLYPLRQFRRGSPAPGIADVIARFGSPEEAWEWLIAANPYTAGVAPIDHLQAGFVDEVLQAAEGALDYT